MKSNIEFNSLNYEISSSEFVMCKIIRCLIMSYLMTSELESPMIFFILYFKLSLQSIGI